MKISNKVLSEMVFFHSRVWYNARCKNVEKIHLYMLRGQNVKKNNNNNKKKQTNIKK